VRKLIGYLADNPRRIVPIGRERARRLLADHELTFQRTKTWKESPDPDRDAKLARIEQVINKFPDRTFAVDDLGPLACAPTPGTCWAPAGRPQRLPANYHKTAGVRQFHGRYSVADDRLWGVVRGQKSAADTLVALRSIRAGRPDDQPVYVILDNLSAHKGPTIRRWAARNNVELCFTPTYASWANPIEVHFGPLRSFVLATSGFRNHMALTRALHAHLRRRNAHARHPDVLAAERSRIRIEHHRWGHPRQRAAAWSHRCHSPTRRTFVVTALAGRRPRPVTVAEASRRFPGPTLPDGVGRATGHRRARPGRVPGGGDGVRCAPRRHDVAARDGGGCGSCGGGAAPCRIGEPDPPPLAPPGR
jgi:hypothetical protein